MSSSKVIELTKDEGELILKALSHYQIHLYDEISKEAAGRASLDSDYRKATVVIKKIHKSVED